MLQKQVAKLNKENSEHSHLNAEADIQGAEDTGSKGRRQEVAELILDGSDTPARQAEDRRKETEEQEDDKEDIFDDSDEEEEEQRAEDLTEQSREQKDGIKKGLEREEESSESEKDTSAQERY